MKEFLKGWFSYSRAERNGIVVLLLLLFSAIGYRLYFAKHYQPAPVTVNPKAFEQDIAQWQKDTILDINTATAEELAQLNGIGPALAQRIVDFRAALGSYVSIEQVNDVKGIGDKKMEAIRGHIKINKDSIKTNKIRINYASQEELETHPYIKVSLAKAIIKRRDKKGPFENWDDLKALKQMDDETFNTLRPYITLK